MVLSKRSGEDIWIAPSLLAADFSRLAEQIELIEAAEADLLHLDIIDGHFVPNLTFGPPVVRSLGPRCTLELDAHLMVTHPLGLVDPFAKAGIDALTVHVEAEDEVGETLDAIRAAGMRPGLSLRPGTDLAQLDPWLGRVDLILVMSVEPGYGGQSFIPESVTRIETLAKQRAAGAGDFAISVDGGINGQTGQECLEAGADLLISGSYLFGAEDRAAAITSLRPSKLELD